VAVWGDVGTGLGSLQRTSAVIGIELGTGTLSIVSDVQRAMNCSKRVRASSNNPYVNGIPATQWASLHAQCDDNEKQSVCHLPLGFPRLIASWG